MISFLYILLLVAVPKYSHALPCSGPNCRTYRPSCTAQNCESTDTCTESSCDSAYSCRGNFCRDAYSCCNGPSTCRTLRACNKQCCESRSCCESSCCNCPCPHTPQPIPSTTASPLTTTSPPWQPSPLPPLPTSTISATSYPPSLSPTSYNNSVMNQNNNTVIIPTNITIQNEIRSETRITVPVNITVNNVNNIHVAPSTSSNVSSAGGQTNTTVFNITREIINHTISVPYPVQIPVPHPVPVPYVITIPQPQPVPTGCCQTVQPCVPYHYCGCQTSSMQCSNNCFNLYMYQPVNICQAGCQRRNMAIGQQCAFGGCVHGFVDCSSCNGDFYRTYEGFLRCAGCFTPTSWEQNGVYSDFNVRSGQ